LRLLHTQLRLFRSWNNQISKYPTTPSGDTVQVAGILLQRYAQPRVQYKRIQNTGRLSLRLVLLMHGSSLQMHQATICWASRRGPGTLLSWRCCATLTRPVQASTPMAGSRARLVAPSHHQLISTSSLALTSRSNHCFWRLTLQALVSATQQRSVGGSVAWASALDLVVRHCKLHRSALALCDVSCLM
jgi:hypothetical protein